jgi:hypothetical protein
VVALVQLQPPKKKRPGQLAAHIALGITWGGLVGDRGHRKGQFRVLVLGSPGPVRAPHLEGTQDRGATGGAGSPRQAADPIFFWRKPLRTSYISEGTKTGLQAPGANRLPPSYL